jgi:hypothetical protein
VTADLPSRAECKLAIDTAGGDLLRAAEVLFEAHLVEDWDSGRRAIGKYAESEANWDSLVASHPNGSEPAPRSSLEFIAIRDLCAEVDAAGPRRWLIRGIWPAGTYGVHAAEMKAQKTWNAADLAVSVASGTAWLGRFPVDVTGHVLMFAGEGGKASIVNRLRAVCKARGLTLEELPITVCPRAPSLTDLAHLGAMADALKSIGAVLSVIDPLYLSAGGTSGTDLYAMGAMLAHAQALCEDAGCALALVTHFNRKQGTGHLRITGAGPAEWGRVLISADVLSRHTDPDTMETDVLTRLDVIGSEIPDQAFRLRRVLTPADRDNPYDLDTPLAYAVTTESVEDAATMPGPGMPPAQAKLLDVADDAQPCTSAGLVDRVREKYGHGLTRETVSRALNELERGGHMDRFDQGNGRATLLAPHVRIQPDSSGD